MIKLELTSEEADLIKKGLEVIAEQIDDAHDDCLNLIKRIEEQEIDDFNKNYKVYVSRTTPYGFPNNIEEL